MTMTSLRRFQGRSVKRDSTQNISDSLAFASLLTKCKIICLRNFSKFAIMLNTHRFIDCGGGGDGDHSGGGADRR